MSETKQTKRTYKDLGPLGDLLVKACRPVDGVQSIPILADQIGLSAMSLYKWIRNVEMSGRRAAQVVQNSKDKAYPEGRVKLEDFDPYVYK